MKIIDTNGLNHMLDNNKTSDEVLFVTPDIRDEFEVEHEGRLPRNISEVVSTSSFDGARFLWHYKNMLNTYKGRSFYNMTGMGDISILALLNLEKEMSMGCLPLMVPESTVITNDSKLIKKIKKEFGDMTNEFDSKIITLSPSDYFSK
jgi:hypothetical protein